MMLFTQRVCCTWQSAMPGQHSRVLEQAQSSISPRKIVVTCKSPVGDISAVTLIRTDTTLDHSQKAEKVCMNRDLHGPKKYECNKTELSLKPGYTGNTAPQLSKHINQMIEEPSIIGAIVV